MLRRFLFAATGVICCVSLAAAEEPLSLKCAPQAQSGSDEPNAVRRIDIKVGGGRFSVVHVAEDGSRVDRASQYSMRDRSTPNQPAWEGPNKRRAYLNMVGKIVPKANHSYEYVEQLFDARERGAKVYETRARCVVEGEPAPAPATAAVKTPNDPAPGCQAIAEPKERLACYDKAYPPAQAAVVEQPQKADSQDAAKRGGDALSDADLDAMRSTYEKNPARFLRDYAGRKFQAPLQVEKIARSQTQKNRFEVSLERGIVCGTDDQQVISFLTNINKGDKVRASGVIEDLSNGNVELTECQLTSVN